MYSLLRAPLIVFETINHDDSLVLKLGRAESAFEDSSQIDHIPQPAWLSGLAIVIDSHRPLLSTARLNSRST
ncbi:uncharacterized protein N7458_004774 [Penicillium daleae]|uniref:Uncharacterized protein n=1 Tax=Penicillium daleae TaxID=63821 RepID=A0AAD6G394_9EURO|nr:uncharacterized protein N7458_004774 [Penicillium daleae]KAJ5453818.1 hypothetical protein N7458_004774 [Penicillium daleae]